MGKRSLVVRAKEWFATLPARRRARARGKKGIPLDVYKSVEEVVSTREAERMEREEGRQTKGGVARAMDRISVVTMRLYTKTALDRLGIVNTTGDKTRRQRVQGIVREMHQRRQMILAHGGTYKKVAGDSLYRELHAQLVKELGSRHRTRRFFEHIGEIREELEQRLREDDAKRQA